MFTNIPDPIFDFFAADPAGPLLTFAREASDPREGLRDDLEAFLSSFSGNDVADAQASSDFKFFAGHWPDQDRAARVWLGKRLLEVEIARRRLEVVRQDYETPRPRPYTLPSLQDLEIGSDHLVSLSHFRFDGARLLRNEFAFSMLSTTGSPNSTYWLLLSIYDQGLADRTRVRLDPFLYGPVAVHPAIQCKMWVYGRPLDWHRVEGLQEPEHGRWMPESLRSRCQFTDYAWTPRNAEVHFVCEEIPNTESVSTEPARYLHAVYARDTKAIKHFDGAIRVYSDYEIKQRRSLHARNAGKVGLREKIFLVEELTDPDALSQVAQAFFVWNNDVQQYFSSTLAVAATA